MSKLKVYSIQLEHDFTHDKIGTLVKPSMVEDQKGGWVRVDELKQWIRAQKWESLSKRTLLRELLAELEKDEAGK